MTATEQEQQWIERVRHWRESGQTARRFSMEHGYSASALYRWAQRLKGGAASETATAEAQAPIGVLRLARVERAAAVSAGLTVEIGVARLRVPTGADPTTLRTLIRALVEAAGGGRE
jgi:hypothetical protein